MSAVEVLRGGTLTTVQDLGRPGHRAAGVPASGAMDPFAAAAANLLTGNEPGAALLEITLRGPVLRFGRAARIALTGARFAAALDSRPIPWERSVAVAAGATLEIGNALGGARAWLAVDGGIAVPPVLGSRSTHLRGGFGGHEGRALAAGDRLPLGPPGDGLPRRLAAPLFAPERGRLTVRILPGAGEEAFPALALERLTGAEFRVSPLADRVGIRLSGPPIAHRAGADIPPEGTLPGMVQVPGGGEPIVFGPDGPTTGGYAKIATVAAADLGALAWLRPGDRLRFRRVTLGEAREALARRRASLAVEICSEIDQNPREEGAACTPST
ncbi:MAG TPA: biotin-dependent carboxyltransferase family protein [Thermoanaerobaculia bacterium]|nr:biotin-dependent carboxyltransferase family protein [Thermoanaerobaculia bacterium]